MAGLRQLARQIDSQFYERTALSHNKAAMLKKRAVPKPEDTVSPEEEIKDPFVLEFLGLKDEYSLLESDEKMLETENLPRRIGEKRRTFFQPASSPRKCRLPPASPKPTGVTDS